MPEIAVARYVFGTAFEREEERLTLGERLWDPGTIARLDALGVGPGKRCLEVGAGRGSIAAWMAGRGAAVTAVDIDTSRLNRLRALGVAVCESDISVGEVPEQTYDLVHARLVVQHVGDRAAAVRRMVAMLRPGGHLVLEDTDTASLFSTADGPLQPAVKAAAYAVMIDSGYHARCGLLDVELALAAGLHDVRAEGRAEVVAGGTPEGRWFALWLEHLRPAMVAADGVSDVDIDGAVADLADPGRRWLSQVMVTVTGRKDG
ncbi:class I SAM-dependent methyltransferase [Actinokineospora sp. NBRC 105648]|uniref:class I SAM-dependent methyltransferase n=1 Tax=Actinokineospora sp. NBRC 105648 TaxID=3032206 RepID=UPI0024A37D73|nr:class I SAM-dependent methyltransferase [Actinokineospora sp. NBRC 105648]GLZ36445.1 methyltransferase [Actinokineospora sp. NBRC 105648]